MISLKEELDDIFYAWGVTRVSVSDVFDGKLIKCIHFTTFLPHLNPVEDHVWGTVFYRLEEIINGYTKIRN